MRHERGQSLADLWDGVAAAWHDVTSGRGWGRDKAEWGSDGLIRWARVVEVTHGVNGWHVHVHAVLLLPSTATDASVDELGQSMFGRWRDSLGRHGFADPSDERGVDIRRLSGDPAAALGEYFTKTVYKGSHELTASAGKLTSHGNRSPFGILAALVDGGVDVVDEATGEIRSEPAPADLALWREWEAGSKGRRQIGWSQGLRAELLPEAVELTDEELAEQDRGGDEVAVIEPAVWRVIRRRRLDYAVLIAFTSSRDVGTALLATLAGQVETDERRAWGRNFGRKRVKVRDRR